MEIIRDWAEKKHYYEFKDGAVVTFGPGYDYQCDCDEWSKLFDIYIRNFLTKIHCKHTLKVR